MHRITCLLPDHLHNACCSICSLDHAAYKTDGNTICTGPHDWVSYEREEAMYITFASSRNVFYLESTIASLNVDCSSTKLPLGTD